ncbi:unnamed protein product, partial [Adineta steineri]
QKPIETFVHKREKRIDAVLAYFLIETPSSLTLPQSKLYELFTPKTKYLLSHPVCQLVTEIRKAFNHNKQININLQPHILPETELLKQGIREACRDWAQIFKQQPHLHLHISQPPASATSTSPIESMLPTNSNEHEQVTDNTRARASTIVGRVQRLIGHESVGSHASRPSAVSKQPQNDINNTISANSAVRRRMTVQNTRSNASNKDTIIEGNKEPSSAGVQRRRTSSFISETLRRLEPTANINNTTGYKRINTGTDASDIEDNKNGVRSNKRHNTNSLNETTYYIDAGPELVGPVEQLFKILLEYAGVELSVASSIEPLFEKLGQTVLASAQIKRFDVKILPNELINNTQPLILNSPVESSVLCVTNLNIQSVFRQSLEYDQLHSANVQAGIRVQRVKQEVNLSLLRIVYQFYTVVGNAVEYTGINEIIKTDSTIQLQQQQHQQQEDFSPTRSRTSTVVDYSEHGIENIALKPLHTNILHSNTDDLLDVERQCWKKLRELVTMYGTQPEIKQITTTTRKQPVNDSNLPSSTTNPKVVQTQARNGITNTTTETLLLSAFGWLIIDEIYYSASLGGLKVDGCMGKVQGSISLSQRLRAIQSNTNNQNPKKYDGSLIVQIGSTSLSLKETLSTSSDNLQNNTTPNLNPTLSSTSSTREISVLDIIVGKSRALTSLQTRGINLTLSGVTNIGTIAMDVPLRPQEVHDLVNRAGRLITSYVQEFLPDDTEQSSTIPLTTDDEFQQMDTSLNNTIEDSNIPTLSEQIPRKKHSKSHRTLTLTSNLTNEHLQTQQSSLSISKRPIFEVHITAHCQGMTFSTTLLSTLKAQYKIGVVEGVANLGSTTSRFTAIIHEHALHFLNNNNTNDFNQLPTVSSDNHVRIDFPQIRCYGNYTIEQDKTDKPKGHLNLRTKIDLLKLTITADFLAQLVFVSKVIIHEINEILAKVSGIDQFHFGPVKSMIKDKTLQSISDNEDGSDDEDEDDEQEKSSTTPFTYKIDISIKGFEVIGQTPSNTVVKFENADRNLPMFIKLTNYDEQNSLLFYNKPLITALLYIKLSLGQLLQTGGFQDAAYFKTKLSLKNSFQPDDVAKEAYFIRLTKPSFYWQPGAIDKGILFWLNYKNTYEHWNEQRGAFTTPTSHSIHKRPLVNVQPAQATTTTTDLNLMFQLDIIDLGIAIPLQQLDQPTKLATADAQVLSPRQSVSVVDEVGDFLVFTLDQTTISACSCGAIISSGSFEGFCFRFAENFQQTNSNWKPKSSSTSNVILNACCVPSGRYLMHSRAKNLPNSSSPKWFLNVQWDMKGIDINIDSIIGKRFSQLIRTITSTHLIEPIDQLNNENDLPINSNLLNTNSGSTININENNDPSEVEERRKRLNYEYSILGQRIATLQKSGASDEDLKPEEARYQWLEKELVNTYKSDLQQKIKPSNKSALNRDRNRSMLSTYSGQNYRRPSSQDTTPGSRHAHSEMSTPQSPIREESTENETLRTPNLTIRTTSHEGDDRQSNTSSTTNNNPNEITSTSAVDLELNVQILIANGSCNLYTRRDLISQSPLKPNVNKQQQQQTQATVGSIQIINKIEYQVLQFSLPSVDVDAHYTSKHNNTTNSSLNKRGNFYCCARVQSPITQIIIHPILLDFIEQTLEYVKLPHEQHGHTNIRDENIQNSNKDDDDHLNNMFLMEDQTSTASFPIDVVVSLYIQPCVLLFTCLPTHPMECELRLPAVDIVFSSKRAVPDSTTSNENPSEQILENSLAGLSFSLYMKDFKFNVYHPFSGESKVHYYEDMRSGQLQTRNALAVSVQSVSLNISRTRYIIIDQDNELLNNIQLSVIIQISKAQFEYDIRRFTEILTFPKIWYNRSLARRLFLGDENLPTRIPPTTRTTQPTAPPTQIPSRTNEVLRKKAHVILAIQLKELHISMRMSNVMGKIEWNTKDVSSTGSLTLTSEGKRTFFLSLGLQSSLLQAEQGIVGGIIRLKNLRTTGLILHELRDRSTFVDASHAIDILTDAIELRLDYMGSPTLMGRISHILLRLKDDRPSSTAYNDSITPFKSVLLNLGWSQLHLMITRSTTPDMIKMATKLTEFFNNHISSSKSILASIQYDFRDRTNVKPQTKKSSTIHSKYDTNIIKKSIGMHGGEIMLQGHNLTLVVFHGLNFKSRQWALFSLNEPQINFITNRGEEGDTNQELIFSLGDQSQTTHANVRPRTNMASISKVTRSTNEAPSHLTINEWFNYASSTISAIGLRDFPTFDEPEISVMKRQGRPRQFDQNAESIFILPALELRFQTRQLNDQVHCSFETEFYEHIMFSFNAEHFYFLHDLITSYIKEKERTLIAAAIDKTPQRSNTSTTDQQTSPPSDDAGSTDTRRFHCPDAKWKLQPTIKLLTAYGNEVEPFGADYVLQKLGFRHARLTIPKWLQRGIMDPCEQSMTIVQLILIFLLPERFKEMCMK